jgi:hypothetical protein
MGRTAHALRRIGVDRIDSPPNISGKEVSSENTPKVAS